MPDKNSHHSSQVGQRRHQKIPTKFAVQTQMLVWSAVVRPNPSSDHDNPFSFANRFGDFITYQTRSGIQKRFYRVLGRGLFSIVFVGPIITVHDFPPKALRDIRSGQDESIISESTIDFFVAASIL